MVLSKRQSLSTTTVLFSPIQDYVHPDDQTQPTFDLLSSSSSASASSSPPPPPLLIIIYFYLSRCFCIIGFWWKYCCCGCLSISVRFNLVPCLENQVVAKKNIKQLLLLLSHNPPVRDDITLCVSSEWLRVACHVILPSVLLVVIVGHTVLIGQ